jgi:hypothetical protein
MISEKVGVERERVPAIRHRYMYESVLVVMNCARTSLLITAKFSSTVRGFLSQVEATATQWPGHNHESKMRPTTDSEGN